MRIKKKIWPEFFELIIARKKRFELRVADFDIGEGDVLVLEEWDPKTKEYTGRKIEKKIDYFQASERKEESNLSFFSERAQKRRFLSEAKGSYILRFKLDDFGQRSEIEKNGICVAQFES